MTSEQDVWVVGGNHSWSACMKVREGDPDLIKDMLVSIFWWPSLDDQSLQEISDFGTRHNIDNELHNKLSFVDKINFLRKKYKNNVDTWTPAAVKEAYTSLGYKDEKSINPLLQLVSGSKNKFELLMKIAADPKMKVASDSRFRCLQGVITASQAEDLLQKVVDKVIDLKGMALLANRIKVMARIKKAATTALNCSSFPTALAQYGASTLGDEQLEAFIPAFKQTGKAKTEGDMPELFKHYIEGVRRRKMTVFSPHAQQAIIVGETSHEIFELDVLDLGQVVKDRATYSARKCS